MTPQMAVIARSGATKQSRCEARWRESSVWFRPLGYRLYGHREIRAEVIAAVERAGYTVHGMPLAAGNKPNIPAADLRELRARGLEVVYALKRPRCKFYCYFGTSKDGERRGYEHWRFGSVEMVILKKLPAPEVRAAETACIAE